MKNESSAWQQIIWREWRHCHDIEYEAQLFALVADEPTGWGSRSFAILLMAITGASLAILIGFIITPVWAVLKHLLWSGALVGAAWGFWQNRHLSWRDWLQRLQSNTPTGDGFGRLILGIVVFVLVSGMIFGPLAWLSMIGLFWGIGSVITWVNSSTDNTETYRSEDRRWWFWWRGRPAPDQVEQALRRACQTSPAAQKIWSEPLHRLAAKRKTPPSPEILIKQLLSNDWIERFTARHTLVTVGQPAVPLLRDIATRDLSPLQQTARWLLQAIDRRK